MLQVQEVEDEVEAEVEETIVDDNEDNEEPPPPPPKRTKVPRRKGPSIMSILKED